MGDQRVTRRLRCLRPWSRVLASLSVLVAFGVFASAAVAGSVTPASDQYNSSNAIKPAAVVTNTTTSETGATSAPTKNDLPYTGLSLLSVVVVGGALVGVGFALRRRNERDQN